MSEHPMPILNIQLEYHMRPACMKQLMAMLQHLADKYKGQYQVVVTPKVGVNIETSDSNVVRLDINDEETAARFCEILDKQLWRKEKSK